VRLLVLALLIGGVGCASAPEGFDSPEPAAELRASIKAAHTHDRSAIPDLIEQLESDDPLVRMVAIRTLEQMTGQTLGYDYAAPAWQRQDKVKAWVEWYDRGSAKPAMQGAGAGVRTGARNVPIRWVFA
jgi:HEAT repeat protein